MKVVAICEIFKRFKRLISAPGVLELFLIFPKLRGWFLINMFLEKDSVTLYVDSKTLEKLSDHKVMKIKIYFLLPCLIPSW